MNGYKYANRIFRLLNFIIDVIIISGLMVLEILFYFYLISKEAINMNSLTEDELNTAFGIIMYSNIFLYYFLFELIFNTTPGKIVTGTRIIDPLGNKPRFKHILIRSLVRLIPIDWLTFFSKEPVGWHDSASDTRVVRMKD